MRHVLQRLKRHLLRHLALPVLTPEEQMRSRFDPRFYRIAHADLVGLSDRQLWAHYRDHGWREGRDPCAVFNTRAYLRTAPDVVRAGIDPFRHYLSHGRDEGRMVSLSAWNLPDAPLTPPAHVLAPALRHFDAVQYRRASPELAALSDEALLSHYLVLGWLDGLRPRAGAPSGQRPEVFLAEVGAVEGLDPGWFMPGRLPLDPTTDLVKGPLRAVLHAPDPATPGPAPADRPLPDPAVLDIHWLLPDFSRGGGGHMTIFRMIRLLEIFGHRCTIWLEAPDQHSDPEAAYQDIVRYYQCLGAPVRFAAEGFSQAQGDAVIATSWSTAYQVAAARGFAGRFYFVQDHEPDFFAAGAEQLLARQSYSFDLACICASPWLAGLMTDRYDRWARHFHLAVDRDIYDADGPADPPGNGDRLAIAVYGRDHSARRAVPLALMALQQLAGERQDFEVHFFGQDRLPFRAAPFPAINHGVLDPDDLAALYRRCDLGICFSATNYSLVPQEMMACGLPVVELDTDSTRAVFPDGVATLAGPDPQAIAARLSALLDNTGSRAAQARKGRDWATRFSWEKAARKVERAIQDRLDETGRLAAAAPAVPRVPDIAMDVVIPTCDGLDSLPGVIAALRAQTVAGALRIHCIDSSSTDGTTEWLRDQPDVALTVIPRAEFQHGRTRNQAAAEGQAPLIAFLTQDATPATPHWAHDLCRMMGHYPGAAGIFGRHLPHPEHPAYVRDEITRHFAALRAQPLALSRDTDRRAWDSGDPGWRQILHYYSNNNSALRRAVWRKIPYPEVEYGEDQLWARAIIEADHTKLYAPTATVWHSHDYDPDAARDRARIEAAFFLTHFGYRLGAEAPGGLEARLAENRRSRHRWAVLHGIEGPALERFLAVSEARLRGWQQGMEEAQRSSEDK